MKHFIYKIKIDNRKELSAWSVTVVKKPMDLIKLMAWEEYKTQNFNEMIVSKETYCGNKLVSTISYKVGKSVLPELIDNYKG